MSTKVATLTCVPRAVSLVVLYVIWILSGVSMMLLVAKIFPIETCSVIGLQKYDDIRQQSQTNIASNVCSYSQLQFVHSGRLWLKDVCSFCNDADRTRSRNNCEEEFKAEFGIGTDYGNNNFYEIPCRKDYELRLAILDSEITKISLLRVLFAFGLLFFLLIPLVVALVVVLRCRRSLSSWKAVLLALAGPSCSNWCSSIGEKKKTSGTDPEDELREIDRPFESDDPQYNMMWDPFSVLVPRSRKEKGPLYTTGDPMFRIMKATGEIGEAELISWFDDTTRFVTKGERIYLGLTLGFLILGLATGFFLFLDKLFLRWGSYVAFDVALPFLNIFVLWNVFLFICALLKKLSTVRVVTNKRIIVMYRLPIYGSCMMWVELRDIEEVNEVEESVVIHTRGGERISMFETRRLRYAMVAINDNLRLMRRRRERDGDA